MQLVDLHGYSPLDMYMYTFCRGRCSAAPIIVLILYLLVHVQYLLRQKMQSSHWKAAARRKAFQLRCIYVLGNQMLLINRRFHVGTLPVCILGSVRINNT